MRKTVNMTEVIRIRTDESTKQTLQQLAAKRYLQMSDIVREALLDYMAQHPLTTKPRRRS